MGGGNDERDAHGEGQPGSIQVPTDRYYGSQTARSLVHLSIGAEGRERMAIEVIHALGLLEKSNALVNRDFSKLPPEKCDLDYVGNPRWVEVPAQGD